MELILVALMLISSDINLLQNFIYFLRFTETHIELHEKFIDISYFDIS